MLEALDSGRLEIGESTLLEPGCWLTLTGGTIRSAGLLPEPQHDARRDRADRGRRHVMFANNCFVGDADHRYDDPDTPITWQGLSPAPRMDRVELLVRRRLRGDGRGRDRRPLRDRRQLGRHQGPAAGGDRAGAPAKVIREIEFK